MFVDEQKLMRLTSVARMYYEKDMSQNDIAKEIGVSRPMVSKLLKEAKSLGIVTIKINEIKSIQQQLSEQLMAHFKVDHIIVVEALANDSNKSNQKVVQASYEWIQQFITGNHRIGIGCGSMIDKLAEVASNQEGEKHFLSGDIFPLIGGIKASYRSYHTNELVRSFAEAFGLTATYFYLPALVDLAEEKEIYKQTEIYKGMEELWSKVDTVFINISNLYSTPDIATSIRFGKRLSKQKAVGRFLAHYYDVEGNFIEPETDNVMQIDIDALSRVKTAIAICGINVDVNAAIGAMQTGLFTHFIVSQELAQKIIEQI